MVVGCRTVMVEGPLQLVPCTQRSAVAVAAVTLPAATVAGRRLEPAPEPAVHTPWLPRPVQLAAGILEPAVAACMKECPAVWVAGRRAPSVVLQADPGVAAAAVYNLPLWAGQLPSLKAGHRPAGRPLHRMPRRAEPTVAEPEPGRAGPAAVECRQSPAAADHSLQHTTSQEVSR